MIYRVNPVPLTHIFSPTKEITDIVGFCYDNGSIPGDTLNVLTNHVEADISETLKCVFLKLTTNSYIGREQEVADG